MLPVADSGFHFWPAPRAGRESSTWRCAPRRGCSRRLPEARSGKNRLHLDIAPATGTQEAEVERLVDLGATRLASDPELPWVVLADPEGNEFCVLPPDS
jgi:glyoxalase superfamily protein